MESDHEAEVAPADVYRFYSDPTTWGDWAHNTKFGRAAGPLTPGSVVEVGVRSYPWTYSVRVREVIDGRRIVCEVRPVGVRIVSTYDVTPTDRGARLHHTIELDGPLERGYRLLRGQYTRMLQEETRRVAELAAGTA